MKGPLAILLLLLASPAAAQDVPKFKTLKEFEAAVLERRAAALKAIETEDLVIPEALLQADGLRNDAERAWWAKEFDQAREAFGKAWAIYPTCIEQARAELKRLEALRQKKPPQIKKTGFKQRKAIHLAMQWLAQHQDASGRWDGAGFMKHDPANDRCDGVGGKYYDIGITALAVLTFLEAGFTDRDNHYALEVHRGIQWLRAQQTYKGVFGTNKSQHFHYNHAITTLVLAKALALTKDKRYEAPLKLGVDYILSARAPGKGWRYEPKDVQTDTSITTWCFRALLAAKEAGIAVDMQRASADVADWLDSMTTTDGRIGYTSAGSGAARPEGKESFTADRSRAMTAAGAVLRQLLQGDKPDKTGILRSLDRCLERPPAWEAGGSIDMYYWYYGTLACRCDKARARKWKKPLHKAVIGHQHKLGSGARTGSWDPIGVWCAEGGRVYATAILTLALIHAG